MIIKFMTFYISTTQEPSVHRIDLRAPTLAGPLGQPQYVDPLAVLDLDNRLCIY